MEREREREREREKKKGNTKARGMGVESRTIEKDGGEGKRARHLRNKASYVQHVLYLFIIV